MYGDSALIKEWQFRLISFRRGTLLVVGTLVAVIAVACTSDTAVPISTAVPINTAVPIITAAPISTTVPISTAEPIEVPPTAIVETVVPEYDVERFARINPNPEIRELDLKIDFGFDERERIPRDAIEPVYTPKFVSPAEASLRPDEIVMGLEINGDVRAYPTGIMRFREMVNDEVGGTPVLVTW